MPGYDMFKPLFPALSRTSDIHADRLWGKDKGMATDPISGLVAMIAIAIFADAFVSAVAIVRTLPHLFTLLVNSVTSKSIAGFVCGVGVVGVGTALFELRRRLRGVYAILEIAFAFATIYVAVQTIEERHDLGVWLAFATAAYLVVRGLDNFQLAKAERARLGAAPSEANGTTAGKQQLPAS
jgi:hypothetical protein